MKKSYLRTSIAFACAFGLVACGGSDPDLVLQISSISGLTMDGLTVSNNGGTPEAVDYKLGYFRFKDMIGSDSNFDIKVEHDPSNAKCTVFNGKGKTATWSPTNIAIQCIANPHNVTATITGLTSAATGLVVVNGSARYEIAAGTTTYEFTKYDETKVPKVPISGQVGDGVAYGFVVLTQPTGKTCSIPNGGGIMGSTDVTITIDCK